MNKRNKIAGAIYGFAIGDAMGATTEFMTPEQIAKKYGCVENIIGGGWLNLKPGQITDDTEMTICVMNALMRKPKNIKKFEKLCAKNFVDWYDSNPRDIGAQCARGIETLIFNRVIRPDKNALGNGSLMRAMPCALIGNNEFNVRQGILTHNNKVCSDIILEYSGLIQEYINSDNNNLYTYKTKALLEPSGYIINTFNNSLYWSSMDSFKNAIIGAVNHGGDADTIAAITGSLAGARFGLNNIPVEWIKQLDDDVKIFLKKFINFTFSYLQI